jgi:hypothetical protein
MKAKYLIVVLFLGIATFLINSCAFLKGNGSTSNETSICMNYSMSGVNQLPVGLVHDMVNGYKDNQLLNINDQMQMEDARAVWFDLETLKKFIYHIENKAKNDASNPTSIQDLGIRIYYASYPAVNNWGDIRYDSTLEVFKTNPSTLEYGKKHTLVMIPTIKRNNLNIDFNPLDPDTYIKRLDSFPERYGPNGSATIMTTPVSGSRSVNSQTNSTSAQNHGDLYPPFGNAGLAF